MKFCLAYNKKQFGRKTFKTYSEAANFLRALLNMAEIRYFAAVRSQNRHLSRELRTIRRRLTEEVRITRTQEVELGFESLQSASGFFL